MSAELMSTLVPIAVHFLSLFAAGLAVAVLASLSGHRLVGVEADDE